MGKTYILKDIHSQILFEDIKTLYFDGDIVVDDISIGKYIEITVGNLQYYEFYLSGNKERSLIIKRQQYND